jgi:SAM-dependent methyltransferase
MQTMNSELKKAAVRKAYGKIASSGAVACCGGDGSSCCGTSEATTSADIGYSDVERASAPDGADLGLGCGNPQAIASLRAGERVLDLGSGAGFDAFLAARQVGPTGHVIGVDMTAEMIARARANGSRAALEHVEFRLGEIEHLPVADASVDVIMSNCVINLSPDKPAVFREAFRVLAPGGRLAISDIVAIAPLPSALREDLDAYTGCVSGAALIADLETMLRDAGFVDVRVEVKGNSRDLVSGWAPGASAEDYVASALIQAQKTWCIREGVMNTSQPVVNPAASEPVPNACCESTLLERCCLPQEKSACCGSVPSGSQSCGCQPARPRG